MLVVVASDGFFGSSLPDFVRTYGGVFALGFLVGLVELLARYRDSPLRALANGPAFVYEFVNGTAAVITLAVIRATGVTFGTPSDTAAATIIPIFIAGFGAMAFLRSSFFTVRIDENMVPIGPSSFLQVLLNVADRAVDRIRAAQRAKRVATIVTRVSFAKMMTALPTVCFALMQNVPDDEQKKLAQTMKELDNDSKMADQVKTIALALELVNIVGFSVLTAAWAIAQEFMQPDSPLPATGEGAGEGVVQRLLQYLKPTRQQANEGSRTGQGVHSGAHPDGGDRISPQQLEALRAALQQDRDMQPVHTAVSPNEGSQPVAGSAIASNGGGEREQDVPIVAQTGEQPPKEPQPAAKTLRKRNRQAELAAPADNGTRLATQPSQIAPTESQLTEEPVAQPDNAAKPAA